MILPWIIQIFLYVCQYFRKSSQVIVWILWSILHFSQMSFKRKRPGDWGTLGDGFEGLDVDKPQVKRQKDRGLPGACRLHTSKNDMNDDPS